MKGNSSRVEGGLRETYIHKKNLDFILMMGLELWKANLYFRREILAADGGQFGRR